MSRTWKKREREKKRRRKKRQKRRWKTKDAVRHDPIPVMKMISFERETRFLKPLVIVFIFYSSFVVESCDNQRDPWRPLALFFTWTFVILMRSVKQTTIQPRIVFPSILRFSFLPSFLPFFFSFELKGGLAKEMLEMFRSKTFSLAACYTRRS